jgi:hypothetical protein
MKQPHEIGLAIATILLDLNDKNVSRHLDELFPGAVTDDYGRWCLEVFSTIVSSVRNAGDKRVVLWVASLAPSRSLRTAAIQISDIQAVEDTSIYLYEHDDFFAVADEEYRKVLAISRSEHPLSAVFRSWRDRDAARDDWEFNNSVYIWSADQKRTSIVVS